MKTIAPELPDSHRKIYLKSQKWWFWAFPVWNSLGYHWFPCFQIAG